LVALYGDKAAISGPVGDQPPTFIGLEPAKVERVCSAALLEPDRHAALRFLASAIPELESSASGLRNEGLFATHELINGVPTRDDWGHAVQAGVPLLRLRDRELLRSLDFTLEQTPGREYVLRAANTRVALALLLDRNESPDMPSPLFSGVSPISQALAKADTENLDYVIVISGPQLRLYPARTGVGTGQRGRSETFAEVHLDLLSESQAGYLWLLFSAGALQKNGSVGQILESSSRYAVELGARLRGTATGPGSYAGPERTAPYCIRTTRDLPDGTGGPFPPSLHCLRGRQGVVALPDKRSLPRPFPQAEGK
jgi:hypothetical protein